MQKKKFKLLFLKNFLKESTNKLKKNLFRKVSFLKVNLVFDSIQTGIVGRRENNIIDISRPIVIHSFAKKELKKIEEDIFAYNCSNTNYRATKFF